MRGLPRLWSGGGAGQSSTALIKKVLLSLVVVGVLGTITVHRVEAVFVVESANTNANVSTGTFTFDTSIGTANVYQAACSSGGAVSPNNNQNTCTGTTGTLFAGTTPHYPGVPSTVQVKVKNTGSVDAQDLQMSMQNCQPGGTGAAGVLGATQSDPCTGIAYGGVVENGGLQLYIQETDSTGTALTNGCLYPDPNAKPHVPADAPGTGTGYATCAANWLNNSFADFYSVSCWDLGRIAAGATRYFTVGVEYQVDSPNSYQATNAKFDLTLHLDSIDGTYTPSSCAND